MGTHILNPLAISKPFNWRISQFEIEGYSNIDKFGNSIDVATGDVPITVWTGKTLYEYTENNGALYYFSSSNNLDTQPIQLYCLTVDEKGNWNLEDWTQNLVGQTKTLLTPPSGNPIVRIYRATNEANEDDASNYLLGDVYIYEDSDITNGVPDDLTKLKAQILNGSDQTGMCIYTIPSGYVGFLIRGEAGINKSGGVSAEAVPGLCREPFHSAGAYQGSSARAPLHRSHRTPVCRELDLA